MGQIIFPRALPLNGRQILLSGRGRSPGAMSYLDAVEGQTHEIFAGSVIQTGAHFSLVDVGGNKAMPCARVDQTVLQVPTNLQIGSTLLMGPLQFSTQGPSARAAWPARRTAPANPPAAVRAPRRESGVIGQVAPVGTFGRIISHTGRLLFVHRNDVRSGQFRVGQRVTFLITDDGRGPKAIDVHAM